MREEDRYYMQIALQEAKNAYERGEVPIGAVIVYEGRIIGRTYNQVEMLHDPTAHAEMIAITQATSALGNWRLNGASIYVTKEPCAMCTGAIMNSRISRIVFGCSDREYGACGGVVNLFHILGIDKVEVVSDVEGETCRQLLQRFFRELRLKGIYRE